MDGNDGGDGGRSSSNISDYDVVSSLRGSDHGPGGAGKVTTTTITRNVSTRLKRSTGASSTSSAHSDMPRTPSANALHQGVEGGIQKHVEISISEEPAAPAVWGVSRPAEAYTITRAYNEPVEPDPAHHHRRLGRT